MKKPDNPYRQGTLTWKIFEGDWADLTTAQIAQTLDVPPHRVRSVIANIRRDTGWKIPRRTETDRRTPRKNRPGERGRYRY